MTPAVWVAVIAVIASTGSSILALVLSGRNLRLAQKGYDRTEDRYQDDRRDARKENLRDALINVTLAVHAYTQAIAWYGKLLNDRMDPRSEVDVDTVNQYDVDRLRPAAGEVYRATLVVEFLTSDKRLTTITDRINRDINRATKTVNSFRPTVEGTLVAVNDLKDSRKDAAVAAAELITVAKELLPAAPDA